MTYNFPEPDIQPAVDIPFAGGSEKPTGGYYVSVTMEDLPLWSEEGKPMLPFKTAQILLPDGSEVQSITVTYSNKTVIPGSYTVMPGQEAVPLSYEGLVEPSAPDSITYSSTEAFPGYLYSDDTVQSKTGYTMLLLNLHPIEYIPAEGRLSYYESMTVKVTYTPGVESDSMAVRDSTQDREIISNMVDNPVMVNSYKTTSIDSKQNTLLPTDDYEYVIITNADLESNTPGPNNFQALRDDKIAGGMTATIVTTEWIYANYDGTRPDGGADDQTRIRNFIIDAYSNWGTRYVLLGGDGDGADVDGESGDCIIPHRGLASLDNDIPADMYYACLDGTFDYDADGIYGEPNDGPGGGEVDLFAEVYVGRAPVDSYDEVSNFVNKTLYYTHLPISDSNLRKVWMAGEYLGFGGIAEWGGNSKDEVKDGSSAHGYTTIGFENSDYKYAYDVSTLYDRDWPDNDWPVSEIIGIINDDAHLINHLGHANVGYVMKMVNSDVDALTNDDLYFIGYSQGCYDGAFDNRDDNGYYQDYDCISEHLTTEAHGAVAFVSNSRYGWGTFSSTDGPSQHYDREFWDALLDENILTIGQANQDSKEDNAGHIGDSIMRWCYYELNLFGDPALEVKINRGDMGIVYNDYVIDDSGGNGEADSGESFTLDITLVNLEAQDATSVSAVLLTSDPYVTITDNQQDWGNIDSGATSTQYDAFGIQIADNVPDQHRCVFTLDVIGNGPVLPPPWFSGFHFIVNAPELSVGSMTIDTSSGDGDGILDLGETANILVETSNIGHYGAEDTTAYLFCSSGYVNINTPSDDLGLVLGGDSTTAIFSVSIAPDAPIGEFVEFEYLVESGSYSAYESFTKMIGCTYSQVGQVGDDSWTVTSYPFNTWWMDSRTQSILLADEIQFAGPIQKIKLFCVQLPGQNLENFYIRMQHTTMDSFPSNEFVNDGWTYVLSATDVDVSQWNIPGWVEFRLDTPFYYNGIDNLLIDYCVDNSFWTSGGLCHVTQAPGRTLIDWHDGFDNNLLDVTYGQSLEWLNNVILTDSPVPTLLYPRDRSLIEPGDILFDWSAEPSVVGYELQIDTDILFGSPDIEWTGSDSQTTVSLSDYGTYYWHVRAVDGGGHYTAYSDTWSLTIADPIVQISYDPNWDSHPSVTQSGDGNVWVVWEADRDWQNHIWYKTSPDDGYTWSAEMPLDTGYGGGHYPDITQTEDGRIWVVWYDYRAGNADLWYMTSPDYGATWSPAVQLTDDPNPDYNPTIIQTSGGTIWVMWDSDRTSDSNFNSDIWYKTSLDNGATWSADTQLTSDSIFSDWAPSITQDYFDGKIWVAWNSNRPDSNGVWLKNSADGGATWSPDFTADLNGNWGSFPEIAATDDGILWLTWFDWRSGNADIWYETSSDGGVSGSEPQQLTRFLGPDQYPATAGLIGGELAVVLQSERAAKNNNDIFFGVIGRNADVYPPPYLEYVWHYPEGPESGDEITIRADVRDESGILDVQLVWWQDGIPQPNLPMYDDGDHDDYGINDGTYGVQIGPFPLIGTVIEYQVQITDIDGITVITPVYPFNFEIQPHFVKTANVLMVADNPGYGDDYICYYTDALQNAGYDYDLWEIDRRGEVPWEILSQYIDGIVVWSTPDWGYLSNDTTMNNLASYLDSGGKLFISGQNIGSDNIGWSWFYQDYLHATYIQDNIGLYGLYSVPPIGPMYLSISGGWGANNQYAPDEIDPIAPAETTFVYDPGAILGGEALMQIDEAAHAARYNLSCRPGFDEIPDQYSQQRDEIGFGTTDAASSGTGALRVDTGVYRLVYFAFGFEAINSASDRAMVMSNVLEWLSGQCWSVPMSASTPTEGSNENLVFGTYEDATDGYDSGIDLPHPPPAPDAMLDAYFSISDDTFGQLDSDFRDPYAFPLWFLHVHSDMEDITLTWNSDAIPPSIDVYMFTGIDVIDMRSQDSVILPPGCYDIVISRGVLIYLFLNTGWNMVSVPVIPMDPSCGAVFPGAAAVYTWNPLTKSYDYISSGDIITPDKGYWVAMTEDTILPLFGLPVYEWTTGITKGWNMIGSVMNTVDFNSPDDDPDGSVEAFAYAWNPLGKYYVLTYEIASTQGSWIAATQDCTLTLAAPDPTPTPTPTPTATPPTPTATPPPTATATPY